MMLKMKIRHNTIVLFEDIKKPANYFIQTYAHMGVEKVDLYKGYAYLHPTHNGFIGHSPSVLDAVRFADKLMGVMS